MAAPDRVLGQANAVLQVVESKTDELNRLITQVEVLLHRLDRATPDIEALRTIVPDIEDVVESLRITTWMKSGDLARHLCVHRNTIARWAREGIIPAYRQGDLDDWMFDVNEVDRAIKDVRRAV